MSKYTEKIRVRLTEEQRLILAKHPHGALKIRNFLQNLKTPKDLRKHYTYSLVITPQQKENLKQVKNYNELIRNFIDTTLKTEIQTN